MKNNKKNIAASFLGAALLGALSFGLSTTTYAKPKIEVPGQKPGRGSSVSNIKPKAGNVEAGRTNSGGENVKKTAIPGVEAEPANTADTSAPAGDPVVERTFTLGVPAAKPNESHVAKPAANKPAPEVAESRSSQINGEDIKRNLEDFDETFNINNVRSTLEAYNITDPTILKDLAGFMKELKTKDAGVYDLLIKQLNADSNGLKNAEIVGPVLAYLQRVKGLDVEGVEGKGWKADLVDVNGNGEKDVPKLIHMLTDAWDTNENGKVDLAGKNSEKETLQAALAVNLQGYKKAEPMINELKIDSDRAVATAKTKVAEFRADLRRELGMKEGDEVAEAHVDAFATLERIETNLTNNNPTTIEAMHTIGKMQEMKEMANGDLETRKILEYQKECGTKG